MKHKSNILLLGFTSPLSIESLPGINFTKCNSIQQLTELLIINDYHLIISSFIVGNSNAVAIHQSLDSIKKYYAKSKPKDFKLLILTGSIEEDQVCKENKLLYFPKEMNIKSLILKLIELPKEPNSIDKKNAIIDFKELFIRVDNNRKFVKEVIEKFFAVKDSRLSDIRTPLVNSDFKKAKEAAHKLKGVLANFSMIESKVKIIELEKLILSEDKTTSIKKLNELIESINNAELFYLENQDQFKIE